VFLFSEIIIDSIVTLKYACDKKYQVGNPVK